MVGWIARAKAHWREGVFGGVAGAFAAWIVMVVSQTFRKGTDLIVNSDVLGAAIGAGLAVAGARYLDSRKQKATVQRAKALAIKTAANLGKEIRAFQHYMDAYLYFERTAIIPEYNANKPVDVTALDYKARSICGTLNRAASSFDIAANAVLIDDEVEMIRIGELSRLVKDSSAGLDLIPNFVGPGGRNDHVAIGAAYAKASEDRGRLLMELELYALGRPSNWEF